MSTLISKRRALAVALAAAVAATGAQAQSRIENRAAIEAGAEYVGFIVKFDKHSTEGVDAGRVPAALERAAERARAVANPNAAFLRFEHVRRLGVGADVVRPSRGLSKQEALRAMESLAALPNVEYVEPDLILRPALTPNDTRYSEQWGFFDADAGIRADQAWDVATGTGIVVAVLDTGQAAHSDMTGNLVAGYDFITNTTTAGDGNGRDADPSDPGDFFNGQNSSWHGTHVAGTVAARTNNGVGVAGTAFNAKVMPVRVLGRGGGSTSDIADAITWSSGGTVSGVPTLAAADAAEVINMSLGGTGSCGSTTQTAINGAVSRGATIVVAAGNSNTDVSTATPANCNNVIAVASVTSASARSSFSNYGTLIDVSAPGSGILSTLNAGTTTPGAESYASYNGTSMATPHVAGTVALVQSRRVALGLAPYTPAEMEALLKNTAYALAGACTGGCGAGIINAKAAVDAAGGTTPPPPPPPPASGTLTNGVAATNISGAAGSQQFWTLQVPSGASNLRFVTSGGTGDADLFVRFGSQPTTTTFDCKSEGSTNAETCTIATAQAGTYHVMVRGYSAFSGLSLTGSFSTSTGGAQTYTNGNDVAIRDNATVESSIAVSGRSGNASSTSRVAVDIRHTYIGDLKVDLIAPDGSIYVLHNRSGGSADNIITTYTVNLSTELLNGTWRLRVNDNAAGDTGLINSWSLTF